jgi:hypothetical protein
MAVLGGGSRSFRKTSAHGAKWSSTVHGYVPVISCVLAPPPELPVRFAEQSKTAALLASRLAEHTAMLVVLLEAIF